MLKGHTPRQTPRATQTHARDRTHLVLIPHTPPQIPSSSRMEGEPRQARLVGQLFRCTRPFIQCVAPLSASQEVVVSTRRREREDTPRVAVFCRSWHARMAWRASRASGVQKVVASTRPRQREPAQRMAKSQEEEDGAGFFLLVLGDAGDVRRCSGAVTATVADNEKVAAKTGPAGRVLRYTGTVKGSGEHGGVADKTTKLFVGAVCVCAGYDFARGRVRDGAEREREWRGRNEQPTHPQLYNPRSARLLHPVPEAIEGGTGSRFGRDVDGKTRGGQEDRCARRPSANRVNALEDPCVALVNAHHATRSFNQKSLFLSRFHSTAFTHQLHLSSFYKMPSRRVLSVLAYAGGVRPSRCEARPVRGLGSPERQAKLAAPRTALFAASHTTNTFECALRCEARPCIILESALFVRALRAAVLRCTKWSKCESGEGASMHGAWPSANFQKIQTITENSVDLPSSDAAQSPGKNCCSRDHWQTEILSELTFFLAPAVHCWRSQRPGRTSRKSDATCLPIVHAALCGTLHAFPSGESLSIPALAPFTTLRDRLHVVLRPSKSLLTSLTISSGRSADSIFPVQYFESMVQMHWIACTGFFGITPKDIRHRLNNGSSVGIYNGLVASAGDERAQRHRQGLHERRRREYLQVQGGWGPHQGPQRPRQQRATLNHLTCQQVCLRNLFTIGKVDNRDSPKCLFSTYLLFILSIIIVLVIGFKFLALISLAGVHAPEDHDKFVIFQVPCYTEGDASLRRTIDPLAQLKYDDKRKLLLIICDGMIVGSGNNRPTLRIVLYVLGTDPSLDPEPLSFLSLGQGMKQHNMGKVYSGLYECKGCIVPSLVLVKVGKPTERSRPGNRGKRDSQMVMMHFLNKMYHQIKNFISVNPTFYEYVFLVDVATTVDQFSVNRLVSSMVHDKKLLRVCGETQLANANLQVVIALRVRHLPARLLHALPPPHARRAQAAPHLEPAHPGLLREPRQHTPHEEPAAPQRGSVFDDAAAEALPIVQDAVCAQRAHTRLNDRKILLSQRRRWINSMVNNLGQLVFLKQLCGFCGFSMCFVVMTDLLSMLTKSRLADNVQAPVRGAHSTAPQPFLRCELRVRTPQLRPPRVSQRTASLNAEGTQRPWLSTPPQNLLHKELRTPNPDSCILRYKRDGLDSRKCTYTHERVRAGAAVPPGAHTNTAFASRIGRSGSAAAFRSVDMRDASQRLAVLIPQMRRCHAAS
ncbi:chitin synthase-domain-containing protein [Mycena sanguinolenta]|nr:chitin synthase-domain-containing protein [Mycena sanguinolenta]